MPDIQQQVTEGLLRIQAFRYDPEIPFIWTSGMQAPVYCDNRLTISYPDLRRQIAAGFAEIIRAVVPDAEVIAGTATAGIPHATLVAELLNLPLVYVRAEAKGHGKGKQIEGAYQTGQKVVLIEDLISTGGSSAAAAAALKEAGMDVKAVLAIFTYQLDAAQERFEALNLPVYALTDLETVLDELDLSGGLRFSEMEEIRAWRDDPNNWEPFGL